MSYIQTETRDHVLIITLNRPEARNAFNLEMAEEMESIIDRYEADSDLWAAILRAEGNTFCAGQDLKAAAAGKLARTAKRGPFGIMKRPPMKPLIAAIDGQAVGGGMELTLSCDLVVASAISQFGLPEVKRGLVAIGGALFRLPNRIPHSIAMEMLLTGEPKSAQEMKQFGFVNSVVAGEQVLDEALRYATMITRNGPLAVKASKSVALTAIYENWGEDEAWDRQMPIVMPVQTSEDLREGLTAFAQKREPIWKAR
jgi:enoyl-CoA hydratase